MKKYLFFIFFSTWVMGVSAQERRSGDDGGAVERLDSLVKVLNRPVQSKIKPFDSVITRDAVAFRGLFTVYKQNDSFYIEVPDSILDLPILVMDQLVKAPGGGKYPGEMLEANTFYFGAGPDSTILLRRLKTNVAAEAGTNMARAVANAGADPVVLKFSIVAMGKTGHSFLVSGQELLTPHTEVMTFAGGLNFHVDRIDAYPQSMNVTFSKLSANQGFTYSYTYVALPRVPMQV